MSGKLERVENHNSGAETGAREPLEFSIGDIKYDPNIGQFLDDKGAALHLRPKTFEVIHILNDNRGCLVSKEELLDRVWPDTSVTQDNLTQCISEIRRLLPANNRNLLKTVHGRGYMLLPNAPVSEPQVKKSDIQPPAPTARSKLLPTIAVLPIMPRFEDDNSLRMTRLVTDDLIQTLSRCDFLAVISRLSSQSAIESEGHNLIKIADTLSADYLVTGSAGNANDKFALHLELSSTATGEVIWSDRIVNTAGNFLSDPWIMQEISAAIQSRIVQKERGLAREQRSQDLQAHTLLLSANDLTHCGSKEKFQLGGVYLEELVSRNPSEPSILAAQAVWCFLNALREPPDCASSLFQKSHNLSEQALDIDENSSAALVSLGTLRSVIEKDTDTAVLYYNRALEINPNSAKALLLRAEIFANGNRPDDARKDVELALRIVRHHPNIGHYKYLAACVYLSLGNNDLATELIQASLATAPNYPPALRIYIASLHLMGRTEDAKQVARKLMTIAPETTVSKWIQASSASAFPEKRYLAECLLESGIPR